MSDNCVKLYALSTCIHCRKAKEFLDGIKVEYDCVYVDKLEGDERTKTVDEIKEFNPSLSFPTILINDSVVVGFKEKDIKRLLGM